MRIPWTAALADSCEITCPACRAPLELSRFTRTFGALGGIAGAFAALYLCRGIVDDWFWATPIVAILAFGFVSALVVLLTGDLAVRPAPAAASFPHSAK